MHTWLGLLACSLWLLGCSSRTAPAKRLPVPDYTPILARYRLLEPIFSLGDSSNWRALEATDSTRLTGAQTRAVVPTTLLDSLNRTDTLFREMQLLTDSTTFPLYRFAIDASHWGLLTLVPWALGGLDGLVFLSVVNPETGSVSCARVLNQSALTQSNAIGVWALRRGPEGTLRTHEKVYWFDGYACPPPACPPRYRLAYDHRSTWVFAPDASGNLRIHLPF